MNSFSKKIRSYLCKIFSKKRFDSLDCDLRFKQEECIRKKIPVPFEYSGAKMFIAPDETSIECIAMSTSKIERLARLINPNSKIIFDIGAHSGLFSRFAQYSCPKSIVIAFEPNEDLLGTLNANQLPGTHIEICAVGSRSGELELFVSPASTQSSSALRQVVEPFVRNGGLCRRSVPLITIDEYCMSNAITHVDVLKIDVQGYEREVLVGAIKILPSVDLLLLEASFLDFESVKIIQELKHSFTFGYAINDVYLGADIALSKKRITDPNKYVMQLW